MTNFSFEIIKKDKKTRARVGSITTPHGVINTPCFTPVGTQASVKALSAEDLREIRVELLFGNTYHLHLRPGEETVRKMGGLSKFMSWNGPTITDSGGFQVFSLAKTNKKRGLGEGEAELVKITEDGVKFRSHIDGSLHFFTPEESIKIQQNIGADLILSLDKNCDCKVCKNYTRGYINHLFRTKELLAYSLASYHNTYFLINLTKKIREAIMNNSFEKMKKSYLV